MISCHVINISLQTVKRTLTSLADAIIRTPRSWSCRMKTWKSRQRRHHSLSLLSRKSWILFKFSSCWPSASSRMPMGDFFNPALSILFSSLFFMLRRRRDAWAKITGMKKDKIQMKLRMLWVIEFPPPHRSENQTPNPELRGSHYSLWS